MTLSPIRPLTSTDDEGTKHVISPEVQITALKDWARRGRGDLNSGALGASIDQALGDAWKGHWAFARAADSLIRRLKEADWLTKAPKGRGWRFTDAGEKALASS